MHFGENSLPTSELIVCAGWQWVDIQYIYIYICMCGWWLCGNGKCWMGSWEKLHKEGKKLTHAKTRKSIQTHKKKLFSRRVPYTIFHRHKTNFDSVQCKMQQMLLFNSHIINILYLPEHTMHIHTQTTVWVWIFASTCTQSNNCNTKFRCETW